MTSTLLVVSVFYCYWISHSERMPTKIILQAFVPPDRVFQRHFWELENRSSTFLETVHSMWSPPSLRCSFIWVHRRSTLVSDCISIELDMRLFLSYSTSSSILTLSRASLCPLATIWISTLDFPSCRRRQSINDFATMLHSKLDPLVGCQRWW